MTKSSLTITSVDMLGAVLRGASDEPPVELAANLSSQLRMLVRGACMIDSASEIANRQRLTMSQ